VQESNRRDFMRAAAGVPAIATGRLSASDRIRVAVIGLRGRGRELINSFHQLAKQNVEIVANAPVADHSQTSAPRLVHRRAVTAVIVRYSSDLSALSPRGAHGARR